MPDYKEPRSTIPQLIAARVKQIAEDYPDLDYLLCFQSEGMGPTSALQGVAAGSSTASTRG